VVRYSFIVRIFHPLLLADFNRRFRDAGANRAHLCPSASFCKEIVGAHGGEIGVDESPGGGATSWFTLPASESDSQEGWATTPGNRDTE
jgi:K+-sensing histidine kinase KdpD